MKDEITKLTIENWILRLKLTAIAVGVGVMAIGGAIFIATLIKLAWFT